MASGMQWGRAMRSSVNKEPSAPETANDPNTKKLDISNDGEDGDDVVSVTSSKNGSQLGEESQQESLRASVEDLKLTIDRLTATLAGTDTKFKHQEARISYLENRCESLMDQNKKLSDRLNNLENASKLRNIKVDGIKEEDGENLVNKILKLAEAMGSDSKASSFDSVYRLGKKNPQQARPRTILIKFKTIQARNNFYNGRFNLKNKKEWARTWINDDVSDQTRRRREAMRSIAILCKDQRVDHKLRTDSIEIKGRRFWMNELEEIPQPYSLEDAKIRCYNDDLYFQSEYA